MNKPKPGQKPQDIKQSEFALFCNPKLQEDDNPKDRKGKSVNEEDNIQICNKKVS